MIVTDTRMDNDNFSCIRVITKCVPITLSTAYHGNEITGISNVLDSWKRQYIQQLQGIVVSYKYVSMVSKCAYIKSDNPTIHYNVKATFELFTPTVGSIVKGKVNRISHDYIGCLVHNSINVAIDRSRNECDSVSHFIALDQVILFEITHIGFKRKIIRLKGKITQECVNLMKNMNLLDMETGSANHNQLTNFSISSSEDTAGEDPGNNFDEDLENGNQSQSLLRGNVDLLDKNLHDMKGSTKKKKKKKSNKFQTEQSISEPFGSLDMESEAMSPSLLCNDSRLFDKDSSETGHSSSKKKKKKSGRLENKLSIDRPFDCMEVKSEDDTLSSLSYGSSDLPSKNPVDNDSHSSKKKKKKFNEKPIIEQSPDELSVNSSFDITLASNHHSLKKKKSKQSNHSLLDKSLTAVNKEENSTDTSSHLSSSSKKKKHKKSKPNTLSSPSLFSDSSNKDENEPFKIPKSPSKKKHKLTQEEFSTAKVTPIVQDFSSSLRNKDSILSTTLSTSISFPKTSVKTEDFDNLMEIVSPYDPSLESQLCNEALLNDVNDKFLNRTEKGKKRKHESPNKDGLRKKKRKIEEQESMPEKTSSKQKPVKTKKKSKGKSDKDSKKDKKKKSKKRVISSKKKLPKLKKKKKEKDGKLKKKLKKAVKHTDNVP